MPDLELPLPWPQFLRDIDRNLSNAVEIHCLGGFVLTGVYDLARTTADLDYVTAIPKQLGGELERIAGRGSDLARKHRVYLQAVGGIVDLPEEYESRLTTLLLGLNKLSLRSLEPYDLILSKLTRNSPKDMEDVSVLAKKLNLEFDILMERFQTEMWVANRERHEQ